MRHVLQQQAPLTAAVKSEKSGDRNLLPPSCAPDELASAFRACCLNKDVFWVPISRAHLIGRLGDPEAATGVRVATWNELCLKLC